MERIATLPFANPPEMVAVTLSSTTLTSRAALTRPKPTKRHARLAVRVHAKLETENDTADKEGVDDATENNNGGFLSGVNNVIKSIWPGSDVANAFNDFGNAKSNPAAKMFDANTMSEAERDALKRQYSQPTFLAALFPVRCEFYTFGALFSPNLATKKTNNETKRIMFPRI